MTSFKTDFRRIDVGMYQDWKQDKKDATWDRTQADVNKSWTLKNDHDQDVVVQMDAYNPRQFPRDCKDADMPEYQFFTMDWKTDHYGSQYSYSSVQYGTGTLYFKNLPKGSYTVNIFQGNTPKNSGTQNF